MPPEKSVARHVLRDVLCDLVELFEVNRKECVKYLANLREYYHPATFYIPKSGGDGDGDEDEIMNDVTVDIGGWRLEGMIVEVSRLLNISWRSLMEI
jgi:nuclear cap-binding protein subunit 1